MKNNSPFLDYSIIVIGLIFVCQYFYKDKVCSMSDLVEIAGSVNNYSFQEIRGIKTHTYNYYINLNEYSNRFQISADLADWFNKSYFEERVRKGDSISIKIANTDYKKINSPDKIFIFGIKDTQGIYMNAEQSIKDYNSKATLYFGLIFIISGFILLRFPKRKP